MRCCKCHKKIKLKDIKLKRITKEDKMLKELQEIKKYQKDTMFYTMFR